MKENLSRIRFLTIDGIPYRVRGIDERGYVVASEANGNPATDDAYAISRFDHSVELLEFQEDNDDLLDIG